MLALESVVQSLDRVNWDFPRSGTDASSVHSMHWFPGNFIPQIPAFLIQILSRPGGLILDPFGGSGTTAIEALRLGRNAISVDRTTACNFLAQAKIAAFSRPLSAHTKDRLFKATDWATGYATSESGLNGEGTDPRLREWYSEKTLSELRFLWKLIESFSSEDRIVLEMLFSDLLFACASTMGSKTSSGKIRRHHWGWIADNVRPKMFAEHDVIGGFNARVKALPVELNFNHAVSAKALHEDARKLSISDESVDAVITSPPYVGVIDYVRANRMLYLWMGWPFDEDRHAEIGARYKRQRTKGRVISEYLTAMDQCWAETARVLRRGGFCAVIIGESRAFPGVYDESLAALGGHLKRIWGPVSRRPTRRRVSDRAATEASEVIAVFQKL